MKCKGGGSYIYKNQNYRLLEIEKKHLFSAILSQKFLIFPNFSNMGLFRKSQCFVEAFL